MVQKIYFTIVDVVANLQARGFILDFSIIGGKLYCIQEQCYLEPEEFDVLEMHCFHQFVPVSNQTDVYAIEFHSRSLKGILLNSGGKTSKQASILRTKIRKFWVGN
ncbi:MAG TPA: hypothetical protein VMH27_21475 [Puia sp.]|nr:hypothetical protein [Puia sp.]